MKKAQRASASLSTRLQQWIVPINVLYLLYGIVWHYNSVTLWTLVGYVLLSLSTYLCFSWVIGAAQEGGSSEYVDHSLFFSPLVSDAEPGRHLPRLNVVYQIRDGRFDRYALCASWTLDIDLFLVRLPRGSRLPGVPRRSDAAQLRVYAERSGRQRSKCTEEKGKGRAKSWTP